MSYQPPYGYPVPPVQTQVVAQPYRCSSAHVVIAWICAALTLAYMLPWAVAATRNRSNVAAIALINLFLGWSLVGWVVALVMACGNDQPVVVVQHTYAPPALPTPPQPWGPPPAQQPWTQAPNQQSWTQVPNQQWAPRPPAPPALGTEPTQQLPRSPWEPDHRR